MCLFFHLFEFIFLRNEDTGIFFFSKRMDWIVNSLLVHFLFIDFDKSGEIRIQLVLLKTILHEMHANVVFVCILPSSK